MPTSEARNSTNRRFIVAILLFIATFVSTLYMGASMELGQAPAFDQVWKGWPFAVPLMAILFAHEMGHYIAGRIHKVDISPPYFIPAPFVLLGTFGAVIKMRGNIKSRDALLDIGAAGPLAGMVFALPIVIYGIINSPIEPLPPRGETALLLEGHSILYSLLLFLLKGPIPSGQDISLTSTAFAGWAGFLVTMINLIPFGQLDGGHIAYALWGKKQNRISRLIPRLLPLVAIFGSIYFGGRAFLRGEPQTILLQEIMASWHWILWALLLYLMTRYAGSDHPPTEDAMLSPGRKRVAVFSLCLFVLLFMPSWIRMY